MEMYATQEPNQEEQFKDIPHIVFWIRAIVGLFNVRKSMQGFICKELEKQFEKMKNWHCADCERDVTCAKCYRNLIGKDMLGSKIKKINDYWAIARAVLNIKHDDDYLTADLTDVAGYLKTLQFCVFIVKNKIQKQNIKKVIEVRNQIAHSPTFCLKTNETSIMISKMIEFVKSFPYFDQDAVNTLENIQTGKYGIQECLSCFEVAKTEIVEIVKESSVLTLVSQITKMPGIENVNADSLTNTIQETFGIINVKIIKEEIKNKLQQSQPRSLGNKFHNVCDENQEKRMGKKSKDETGVLGQDPTSNMNRCQPPPSDELIKHLKEMQSRYKAHSGSSEDDSDCVTDGVEENNFETGLIVSIPLADMVTICKKVIKCKNINTSHLYDGAYLPDGRLVVTDWSRNKLLLFDDNVTLKAQYDVEERPYGVCVSVDGTLIYLMHIGGKIVTYILQGELREVSHLKVQNDAKGVEVSGDTIIAGHDDNITLYNMEGKKLSSISKKGCDTYICVSQDGSRFYHIDGKYIVCRSVYDLSEVFMYSHPELCDPQGIACDRHGNILVVGCFPCNVIMIDKDGTHGRVLVDNLHGIRYPTGVCCHPHRDEFVVLSFESVMMSYNSRSWNTNVMEVYEIN